MYLGEIVETAPKEEFFTQHKHPYSQALLNSVPVIGGRRENQKELLSGDVPSPQNPPAGCKFHTRCPYSFDKCRNEHPDLCRLSDGHYVRCFLFA